MNEPFLKQANEGAAVTQLTTVLQRLGYLDKTSSVFNHAVRRAVKEFQSRNLDSRGRPLVCDGIVGELTWWALNNPNVNNATAATDFLAPTSGGSVTGRAALAVALSEMQHGAREIDANNDGPFVQKYLNCITTTPQMWCAAFVSWCFAQNPVGMPFRYSLGARDIRNQFQRKGWAFAASQQMPEPGDIAVWWRGRQYGSEGHIGIVHRLEHGVLYTIEGNKGGFPARVNQFDYVLTRMEKFLGFGRVP
ncbi:MAG: CHAP domain-containing protein [Halioglobus sp.]